MPALRTRDRFHIVTSVVYTALGVTIVVRALLVGVWQGLIFGAAMLALGLYRGYFICRAWREVRR